MKDLQKEIHEVAESKGWWPDKSERRVAECFANFHAEISEAWEEYRSHGMNKDMFCHFMAGRPDKPEGIGSELADCVIRIMDFCEAYEIDLETIIRSKHEYNKTRSFRHGDKKA